MSQFKDIEKIKLGKVYHCLFKTQVLKPAGNDSDVIFHIGAGTVTAKGLQRKDDGTTVPFVEICGERVEAEFVHTSQTRLLAFANQIYGSEHVMPPADTLEPTPAEVVGDLLPPQA